jgi:putative transposase
MRSFMICDIGPAPPKQPVSNPIGIDLGLTSFAVLSNGDEIKNPRFAKRAEQRIANANRALARKLRGSKNRLRAKERLRREHQRVADARKNFCHHASKAVLAKYDFVAHEALNIADMAAKRYGKSIMDAAWGLFLFQLTYKAESAGRWVVPVNPRNTTKQCSGCGELVPKSLFERIHSCKCGLIMGRDHNAAVNILRLGRSLVQA